jgi:hypothetical protein
MREIVIRRGQIFYEYKLREENSVWYRTTKVPRSISPKEAADLIAHEWLSLHTNEPLRVAWELTDEEREAGKKGVEWPPDI